MNERSQTICWQGVSALLFIGVAFLLVDGRCRSEPPDPRGTRVTIPETLSAVQHLQGNRTRITFEFEGRDAEVARGLIAKRGEAMWVKVGEGE